MLSSNDYIRITNQLLSKNIRDGLAKHIRNDNQLFGALVTEVMMADYKWDGRGTIEGYRKQRFLWHISTIKELLVKLQSTFRVSNFDNACDWNATVDDEPILYEEFIETVNTTNVLTTKERSAITSVIINLNKATERDKSNIKRGVAKLKHEYAIFNVKRVPRHSK